MTSPSDDDWFMRHLESSEALENFDIMELEDYTMEEAFFHCLRYPTIDNVALIHKMYELIKGNFSDKFDDKVSKDITALAFYFFDDPKKLYKYFETFRNVDEETIRSIVSKMFAERLDIYLPVLKLIIIQYPHIFRNDNRVTRILELDSFIDVRDSERLKAIKFNHLGYKNFSDYLERHGPVSLDFIKELATRYNIQSDYFIGGLLRLAKKDRAINDYIQQLIGL